MTITPETEQMFGSTTFAWRRVKIARPPEGTTPRGAKRSSFMRLPRSERRRPVTLTVVYRGGAESWWLVKARGSHQVFPGHASIEDVMARVHSEH